MTERKGYSIAYVVQKWTDKSINQYIEGKNSMIIPEIQTSVI